MKSMNLNCQSCGVSILQGVEEIPQDFELTPRDEEDLVAPRHFFVLQEPDFWKPAGHLVFNMDDFNTLPPDEDHIGYGCCGYSDCDGPNLFCFCDKPLGYKYTECYTPRMAILIPAAVLLKPTNELTA